MASRASAATEKVYGLAAVRALFRVRPDDVRRIAYSPELRLVLRELLREAAARRIAYEERTDEDLARIAGSVHHEGVCVAARPRAVHEIDWLAREPADRTRGVARAALALDRVTNPHNAGAIVRTAAFFGIEGLIVEAPSGERVLSPAAVRVAQGGAEHVALVRAQSLVSAITRLRSSGFAAIGADAHGELALRDLRWPRRAVIVLGNEGEGLGPEVRAACTTRVRITGSGSMESLNVSVAAGVILASWASGAASSSST